MTKKRCFLAIRIPEIDQYQTYLRKIKHDVDVKLSITRPDLYHFTIHFFGDITQTQIEAITNLLDDIAIPSFDLVLAEPGFIPQRRPKKARVLYINPGRGSLELGSLVDDIRSRLRSIGFDVPKRKYLPHLTIARIKHGRDRERLVGFWTKQKFMEVEVKVDSVELIHSTLTPNGPIYSTIATFGKK